MFKQPGIITVTTNFMALILFCFNLNQWKIIGNFCFPEFTVFTKFRQMSFKLSPFIPTIQRGVKIVFGFSWFINLVNLQRIQPKKKAKPDNLKTCKR